jgi:hypothetical protein
VSVTYQRAWEGEGTEYEGTFCFQIYMHDGQGAVQVVCEQQDSSGGSRVEVQGAIKRSMDVVRGSS